MADKGVGFEGKLLGIGLVAVILAAVGTSFLTFYLFKGGGNQQQAGATAQPKDWVSLPMGDFTVNLADKGGTHFLRASISVGTSSGQQEKLRAQESQIRDLMIQVLRSKTKAELESADGLEALRKELVRKLTTTFGQDKIYAVYFTDFVVQ